MASLDKSEYEPSAFQRLPKSVIPVHYDLTFQLSWTSSEFQCTERIRVKVDSPTKDLVLNGVNFEVKLVEYRNEKTSELVECIQTLEDKEAETIRFMFPRPLEVGNGELLIKFTGEVSDADTGGLKGLYSSKYVGAGGEDKFNYLTFFAPVACRYCFPSWDDPSFKSTFSVSLIIPKGLTGMSNMPVLEEKSYGDGGDLKLVKFDKSPIMSTYLLAFKAGEFDFVQGVTGEGVQCRVYTPVTKGHLGTFALDVATKALSFYTDYFGIPYPLPKLDLVAIGDFPCGAMENWGLITFRETCLLVDDLKTSTSNRQRVALVIAHELAHQWFGNLVTMEWWTHLWLNEGFAEFATFLCISNLFPEYDVWTQFASMILIPAMAEDSLSSSHPIEIPVKNPSEIDEIFDSISYWKGASVIRMLYAHIGDADFRKGMNLYLTRHQYSNATTSDLWKALEEVTSQPINAIMSTWTKQMGYPLLTVTIDDGPEGSRELTLRQEKFTFEKESQDSYKWIIPLSLSNGTDPSRAFHKEIFNGKVSSGIRITIKVQQGQSQNKTEWLKVNPGGVGFYRVDYPSLMLSEFKPAIQFKTMPALDRLQILDDLFAIVKCGRKSTVEVLKLLQAFVGEDHYTVWSTISRILETLDQLLAQNVCCENFRLFALRLLKPVGLKLGWERQDGETHLQILLRPLILKFLVHFEDPKTLQEARKRFYDNVAQTCEIPADFRQIVFTAAMMQANEAQLNCSLEHYRLADLAEEKRRILRSIATIYDPELLSQVLQFSLTPDIKSQDSADLLISVGLAKNGRELAWEFFKTNWKIYQERYPGGFTICNIVKYLTENFTSDEKATEVESFFRQHSFRGVERTVQQSIESIGMSRDWLQRDEAAIKEYLQIQTDQA